MGYLHSISFHFIIFMQGKYSAQSNVDFRHMQFLENIY